MIVPEDLAGIRELSLCLHDALVDLSRSIFPGIGYNELASKAQGLLNQRCPGAVIYTLDLNPNGVVCHNSRAATSLFEGDIYTIDMVVKKNGLFSDQAWSGICGEGSPERNALLAMAWDLSRRAVLSVEKGESSLLMKKNLYTLLRGSGFSLVPEACGHGIGREVHMPPDIHFSLLNKDDVIWEPGMVFTAEPVVAAGSSELQLNHEELWVTAGGSDTAYFEHMVAVTEDGYECLNIPEINLLSSIDIFQQII